jgi:hypothetical protein
MKTTSPIHPAQESSFFDDFLDITFPTRHFAPGKRAQMSSQIWRAIGGSDAFDPDDARVRDFISFVQFAVGGILAVDRNCQRAGGCCVCKWNLTPAVARFGMKLTAATNGTESIECPSTDLLIFLGEHVLHFDFEPPQNRLQLIEGDVVLAALNPVERCV